MAPQTTEVLGHTLAAPSAEDAALARSAARSLVQILHAERGGRSKVRVSAADVPAETIEVPASALRLLMQILNHMAEGSAVTLVPVHYELTTQQAADLLSVSRPFLISLLEEGKIPFHRVGTRRKIRFQDLMAYKAQSHEESLRALGELASQAQEAGMGY